MKLSAMKIDPALSEQGDWVENIPDLPGIRIKARGTNNGDYRALEAKLVRRFRAFAARRLFRRLQSIGPRLQSDRGRHRQRARDRLRRRQDHSVRARRRHR